MFGILGLILETLRRIRKTLGSKSVFLQWSLPAQVVAASWTESPERFGLPIV